jgi:small GTP-binding protein
MAARIGLMRLSDGSIEKWLRADDKVRKNLPPGVKLVLTLRGHTNTIGRIAWSPDGRMLASPSVDRTIRLWDVETGECLRTLKGHKGIVYSVAFDPTGRTLASGSSDKTIKLWTPASGTMLRTLKGHKGPVSSIAFAPIGRTLASGSYDKTIKLWASASGKLLSTLKGHKERVYNVAFDTEGNYLASGGYKASIKLWESQNGKLVYAGNSGNTGHDTVFYDSGHLACATGYTIDLRKLDGKLLRKLEGHTGLVVSVSYLSCGHLFASKSYDGTIRLWSGDSGACLCIVNEPNEKTGAGTQPGLAFHPHLPLLATVGSDPGVPKDKYDSIIHIFELDLAALLAQSTIQSVTYTSSKIVLVGESGVGKTGLGWRLAHKEFKEHSSTHGQQFWLLNQLCKQRKDGAQCEAVLWDLAGQPDYRLIHALFLDDADLALVLFDPTRNDDPLSGVEFWLSQLKVEAMPPSGTPTMLIAARSDRGTPRLTKEELDAFCKQRGINAYLSTSAKEGEGIEELIQQMHDLIPWDDKPATVTTETFKRIKDFVLSLKEDNRRLEVILTPEELRQRLEKTDNKWMFSDPEMLTAVGHIANHGYVTRLKTSQGELRILLAPELLNNLAASYVLEARRNPKGLGSLEEQQLLSGEYRFLELEKLTEEEKDILLDSGAVLFLEHNVCFRETDPLNGRAYLVFPELINLKKPLISDDAPTEDDVAYTVNGAVENVYASLVVLMGYTQTFTRTNQWRNYARYEVGTGHVCGFRQEAERAGELDFVLYFGTSTPVRVRKLFQSLFENFLARRNLTVRRFEPVVCSNGHTLNRAVVREQMSHDAEFAFCNQCGEKIMLPKADEPIQLTERQAEEVEANRRAADQRSRFEQVLFRLKNYVTEHEIVVPECFISYAWGIPEHERWVERRLGTDLQKAGITVLLDRWENMRIGASMPRFVERVGKADRVIVVGTPLYRKKYENSESMRSFVVAAEGDLIGKRMIGTEAGKESVLPLLLEGTEESAFPHLLQGRVYADFRNNEAYFDKVFELLLSLFQIRPNHPVATELRESLKGQGER